jgi:glycosyltransferase involved in cell wall biosynthesis
LNKSLHILVLSSWYPTERDPFLGNFVKRHVDLIATQHKVTVLQLESVENLLDFQREQHTTGNLTEIRVRYPRSANPFFKWMHARKAFEIGTADIQSVDFIHGHVILSKGIQFLWAQKKFKRPLLISEHGSYYRNEARKNWSLREQVCIRKVVKAAAVVSVVSPLLKREMQDLLPASKIHVVPNVIDPEVFRYQPKAVGNRLQFVHISTLDERFKNILGILEACELLYGEVGPGFEMQVISDSDYTRWQQWVEDHGLQNCISFAGPLTPVEVAAQLQQSDALVLFSDYETFSCVIAESWATGTPVISTPVGIAENLHPSLGIQVPVRGVAELVYAMKSMINGLHTFDAKVLQEAARNYYPERVLYQFEELYDFLS